MCRWSDKLAGREEPMMRPWDLLRREIRRIPYKLVLALSANFTGSLSYGREIYKIRRRGESFRANIWRAPAGSYSLSDFGPPTNGLSRR